MIPAERGCTKRDVSDYGDSSAGTTWRNVALPPLVHAEVASAYNKEAKVLKYMVAGAVAAFVVSGPLQHIGVLPQTLVGDLSKQAIKSVLGMTAKDAFAGCKGD